MPEILGKDREKNEIQMLICTTLDMNCTGSANVPYLLEAWKYPEQTNLSNRMTAMEREGLIEKRARGFFAPTEAAYAAGFNPYVTEIRVCLVRNGGFATFDAIQAHLTSAREVNPEGIMADIVYSAKVVRRLMDRSSYFERQDGAGDELYHLPLSDIANMVLEGRWMACMAAAAAKQAGSAVVGDEGSIALFESAIEQVAKLMEIRRQQLEIDVQALVGFPAVQRALARPIDLLVGQLGFDLQDFNAEMDTVQSRCAWYWDALTSDDRRRAAHQLLETDAYLAIAEVLHLDPVSMSRGYAAPRKQVDRFGGRSGASFDRVAPNARPASQLYA